MNVTTHSITASIATIRAQTLDFLVGSTGQADGGKSFGDILAQIAGQSGNVVAVAPAGGAASIAGASALGRNMALRAPEAAYAMMTEINRRDVSFKAQYSELGAMKDFLPRLSEAAGALGKLSANDGAAAIKDQVRAFAARYNEWAGRFSPTVQQGGALAGVQAGEIPLYELEQSVTSIFAGAQQGFRGLSALGITIDPQTHLMSVDGAKLDGALASNATGVVGALRDFAGHFGQTADLMASKGNFIQNRMDNLGRALQYIAGNVGGWRQEFGTGDTALPTGQIAKALAAYQAANKV